MEVNAADIKFAFTYLTSITVLWKVSSWATRKQILIEQFFSDTRDFMATTSASIQRIETNHLAHQQESLNAIQAALEPRSEYVDRVSELREEEQSDGAL